MSGFDLNACPTEDDDIAMNPPFCTQAPPSKMVEESTDPMVSDHELGGGSNDHSGRGPHNNLASHNVGNNNIPTTTMPTKSTTYLDFEEGGNDRAGMHEEVLSTPQKIISWDANLMRTSHLLIQPIYLQPHKYKDRSLELVPNNLTIRYFRFLELFLTYMRI
jgi:hypothetical protein